MEPEAGETGRKEVKSRFAALTSLLYARDRPTDATRSWPSVAFVAHLTAFLFR
jgi:hypothetical protein